MSEPTPDSDNTSNLANILGYRQREFLGNKQDDILRSLQNQTMLLQRLVQLQERQTLPIDQQRMLLAKDRNDAEIEFYRIAALTKQVAAQRRDEIRFNFILWTITSIVVVVGFFLYVRWKNGAWPFA